METLPDEILEKISGLLRVPDILSLRLVNKRLANATRHFSSRLIYHLPYHSGAPGTGRDDISSAKTLSLSAFPYQNFVIVRDVLSPTDEINEDDLLAVFSRAVSLVFVGYMITEDLLTRIVRAASQNLKSLILRCCTMCGLSEELLEPENEVPITLPELECLAIEDSTHLSDASFERILKAAPNVHSLSLSDCGFACERYSYSFYKYQAEHVDEQPIPEGSILTTYMMLRLLNQHCRNLKSLNLSGTQVGDIFVNTICNEETFSLHLDKLMLDNCIYLKEDGVKRIFLRFPGLKLFSGKLMEGAVTDESLSCAPTGSLLDFRTGYCSHQLSSAGVGRLVKANPNLEVLGLSNLDKEFNLQFLPDVALKCLTTLDLSGLKLGASDWMTAMEVLAQKCKATLKSLNLSWNPGVTDAVLQVVLGAFKNLEVLRLSNCNHMTDAGLIGLQLTEEDMETCCVIDSIDASSTGVQSIPLSYLPGHDHGMLRSRDVKHFFVDNAEKQRLADRRRMYKELLVLGDRKKNATLADLPNLVILDLSHSIRISDLTLQHGLSHPFLEFLDVSCCAITNEGLQMLNTTAKNLCELRLDSCDELSDQGVADYIEGTRRLKRLSLRDIPYLTGATLSILPSRDYLRYRGETFTNAGIN